MADHATPNLPSRDFDATLNFYGKLGFKERWRGDDWMILERGDLICEFFPFSDLDPFESSFGCCFRLDELDEFYALCKRAGVPEAHSGIPRLVAPLRQHWGGRIAYLVDADGSLLRLIDNR